MLTFKKIASGCALLVAIVLLGGWRETSQPGHSESARGFVSATVLNVTGPIVEMDIRNSDGELVGIVSYTKASRNLKYSLLKTALNGTTEGSLWAPGATLNSETIVPFDVPEGSFQHLANAVWNSESRGVVVFKNPTPIGCSPGEVCCLYFRGVCMMCSTACA